MNKQKTLTFKNQREENSFIWAVIVIIAVLFVTLFADKDDSPKIPPISFGARKEYKVEYVLNKKTSSQMFVNAQLFLFRNNPFLIKSLHHRQFERFIKNLFSQEDYDIQITPQTRDGGKDLVIKHKNSSEKLETYYIECKRYKDDRKVGIDDVRRLHSVVITDGVTQGILFTTSQFTKGAKELQKKHEQLIILKDFDDILFLLYA